MTRVIVAEALFALVGIGGLSTESFAAYCRCGSNVTGSSRAAQDLTP